MNASEITREEETGLSLTELMMLPIVLMAMMFQVFAQHVAKLKESRRTRPLPRTWKEHWPNLRLAEWHIRELTAAGIEQTLAGEDLDLTRLSMDPDPPEDFGQAPASAFDLHRRFEAIARFHADPERYIRRAAERVLTRDGERDPRGRAIHPPPPPPPLMVVMVVLVVVASFLSAASFSAQHIRAPPLRRTPENQTHPTRRPARRERATARDADATTRNLAQLSGSPVARPPEQAYPPLMTTATAKMLRLKWRALIELAPARRD